VEIMEVADIGTKPPITCAPETTLREVAGLMPTDNETALDEAIEEFVEDALMLPGPAWPRGLLRALRADRVVNRRCSGETGASRFPAGRAG
jgi:CBS domain-containing protein